MISALKSEITEERNEGIVGKWYIGEKTLSTLLIVFRHYPRLPIFHYGLIPAFKEDRNGF